MLLHLLVEGGLSIPANALIIIITHLEETVDLGFDKTAAVVPKSERKNRSEAN
jgi:hypothetical protein